MLREFPIAPAPAPPDGRRFDQRRWPLRRRLLALGGLLLLGSIVVWSLAYWRAKRALNAEIARVRAAGDPLWFHELAPPPVPDQQNAALVFAQIRSRRFVQPTQAFYDAYDLVLEKRGERSGNIPVNSAADGHTNGEEYEPPAAEKRAAHLQALEQTIAANRRFLDELSPVLRLPSSQFDLDYNARLPISILLNNVQELRELSRLERAALWLALQKNDRQAALRAADDTLRAPELLRSERLIVSQLVRYALVKVAIEGLAQLLGQVDLQPAERDQFDALLAEIERTSRVRPALVGERAAGFTTISNVDSSAGPAVGMGAGPKPIFALMRVPPFSLLTLDDRTQYLKVFRPLFDEADESGAAADRRHEQFELDVRSVPRHCWMTRLLLPALSSFSRATFRARQTVVNARLALRVDEHYRRTGRLPETLAEVSGELFDGEPRGIAFGEPFTYRVVQPDHTEGQPASFSLHTWGEGDDDGAGQGGDEYEQNRVEVDYGPISLSHR